MKRFFMLLCLSFGLLGCNDNSSLDPENPSGSDFFEALDINIADVHLDGCWEISFGQMAILEGGKIVGHDYPRTSAIFMGDITSCYHLDGEKMSIIRKYSVNCNGEVVSSYVFDDSKEYYLRISDQGKIASNFCYFDNEYYIESFTDDFYIMLDSQSEPGSHYETAHQEYEVKKISTDEWDRMINTPDILRASDPDYSQKFNTMLRALDALVIKDELPEDWPE